MVARATATVEATVPLAPATNNSNDLDSELSVFVIVNTLLTYLHLSYEERCIAAVKIPAPTNALPPHRLNQRLTSEFRMVSRR